MLAVSRGFRDLLHIGNQSRPRIFDLEIKCPEAKPGGQLTIHPCAITAAPDRLLPSCSARAAACALRVVQVLYEDVVEIDELVSLPLGAEPTARNGTNAKNEPRLEGTYKVSLGRRRGAKQKRKLLSARHGAPACLSDP